MRAVVSWTDNVPEHEGSKSICYDVAFRPDGSQLIAAVGSRVLMYDAAEGDLLHSLKGHKDAVYCVAYSRDGKRFASGGADKTIIIWTHKAEGILKYSHGDSVQCLAYNPVTQQLASGTAKDFGIWSPEQKEVTKHKSLSKILCCSWTGDGQRLALGMYSGHISLCDRSGVEQAIIERSAPVWTLQWNLAQTKASHMLAVGCWDGTLSFYDISGKQVGKDKELGFDPCCVSYHDGQYVSVGGSDNKVMMYSKEGIKLTVLCETADWVWTVRSRPKHDYIVVGCNDGSISMLQLVFSTVHGLYQERYAFRDAMTDVVVQHLLTNVKVRIKCADYIKKIAVYKDRLAVQLSNRIVLYELSEEVAMKPHYRPCGKINQSLDCNLLVLTAQHITLCQEKNLQLYSLDGNKQREWILESLIRYIKVCGGPPGGEGLLIGMKNGLIVRVWIHSAFPIRLYKHKYGIRCLDLSAKRCKLAIVDENSQMLVYDLQTEDVVFEELNATSVAWNTEMETMLCYSGGGMLNIKTADFPVHRQKLQGYVVGFQGSKIFCLHHLSMQTIEVPQSTSMRQYAERKQFDQAYRVACLGVTEADWRWLAIDALQHQSWEIARAGFVRIREMCFLDLLHRLHQGHSQLQKPLVSACVLAYEGKFEEAAKIYVEAGQISRAMEMYSDLRMFDEARALAEKSVQNNESGCKAHMQDIIQKQAEWTEETMDHESAADMYLVAGQPEKALGLLVDHGPASKLIEVARRLKKTSKAELSLCASLMRNAGQYAHAFETYNKLGDIRSSLALHMELHQWEDAFALKKLHPEILDNVYIPYGDWLIKNDRFDEARAAYRDAGRSDLAERLQKQRITNAVKEKRFKDASHLCWQLALDLWHESNLNDKKQDKLDECNSMKKQSEIYYAYSFIDQSINEPFRTTTPDALFNIGRYLLSQILTPPKGVSLVNTLVTVAKYGEQLGCYKVAKHAYERLQGLRIPNDWVDKLDLAMLVVRGKAARADDGKASFDVPFCYSCSSPMQLTSSASEESCSRCGQPFFRSFVTFDQLPLVEFVLEEGTSHEQAMELLQSRPSKHLADQSRVQPRYLNNLGTSDLGGVSTLLGQHALLSTSTKKSGTIEVGPATLSRLEKNQVIVQRPLFTTQVHRYYFIVDPLLVVCQCPCCTHFFEQVEWDIAVLEDGVCPFCRNTGLRVSGLQAVVETFVEQSDLLRRTSGGHPEVSYQLSTTILPHSGVDTHSEQMESRRTRNTYAESVETDSGNFKSLRSTSRSTEGRGVTESLRSSLGRHESG